MSTVTIGTVVTTCEDCDREFTANVGDGGVDCRCPRCERRIAEENQLIGSILGFAAELPAEAQ